MLVSLKWLNEYIDISDLSPEAVSDALTDLGLEVEGIEKVASLPTGLVIGEIKEAKSHPNADSLRLCKVDIGQEELLDIVCGAPNAAVGLKAAVATIGTSLSKDFKIKPSKIRGEKSEGMMCSEKELGISEEDEGLWDIKTNLKLGTPVADFFDTSDAILDISLTPNRADCLSYIGIARDLGAKIKRELKLPKCNFDQITDSNTSTENSIKVNITDNDLSQRFCAITINDITPSKSPAWLQKRVSAGGMRPINLIVDITNYVLLEYGQPIHAYDKSFLEKNEINVRSATSNDNLTTLDGNKLKLNHEDILICDGKKPVGLAGIMGGENSEVKDNTKNIIVEVAEFSATKVRKTSKRLGLHTEASHRFERGIDINALATVAKRVADLLVQCSRELGLSLPKVASDYIDHYPTPKIKGRVALRLQRTRRLLAMPVLPMKTCINHLESLGIKLLDKTEERMLFEIPTWRQDIVREVDLIEEVARLEGFDAIPYEMPKMNIAPTPENGLIWFIDELKTQIAQLGLSEVITFPFVSTKSMESVGIDSSHPFWSSIKLANPISEEYTFMQSTMLPGLLSSVMKNRNHGNKGSKLFEVGRNYFDFNKKNIDKEKYPVFSELDRKSSHYSFKAQDEKRPIERQFLSCILDAPFKEKSWNNTEILPSFYHIKKIMFDLFHSLGINAKEISLERPNENSFPFLHPGASALLKWNDKILGWMGEVNPRVAIKNGFAIEQTPIISEVDVEILYSAASEKLNINAETIKFPPVTRDLALLVEKSKTHNNFLEAFASFKKKNLKDTKLFDVYQGTKIPDDKKSFAYTLSFQSDKKTLTDKEVDKEVQSILKWLKDNLQAEQR